MNPTVRMQVQLEQLTSSFQSMTEDLRQRLVANVSAAFPSDDEMSPLKGSFQPVRTEGFALPERPAMASSGAVLIMSLCVGQAGYSFFSRPPRTVFETC